MTEQLCRSYIDKCNLSCIITYFNENIHNLCHEADIHIKNESFVLKIEGNSTIHTVLQLQRST